MPGYGDPPNRFSKENQPAKRGRPKGSVNLKTLLEKLLFTDIDWKDIDGKTKRMTCLDAMNAAVLRKAMKGDIQAYKELTERIAGKVPNKQQIGGDPDNPTGISVNVNLNGK